MKLQLEPVSLSTGFDAYLFELRETYQRGVFAAIRVSKNLSTVSYTEFVSLGLLWAYF